jgi:hypothetical protein
MMLELFVAVLAAFGVWIWGLIDVLRAREEPSRLLSQDAWTAIVFFAFAPGALAWLALGRPRPPAPQGDHDEVPTDVDRETVEEFRERTRARAQEQRRRYFEQRLDALEEDSAS